MKKFKLIRDAQTVVEQQTEETFVVDQKILDIYDGDIEAAQVFTESVVDLLGTLVAQVGAGKNPLQSMKPDQQQMIVRMVSGAKFLKEQPGALKLDPNSLKMILTRIGEQQANATLASIGDRAPQVEKAVTAMFQNMGNDPEGTKTELSKLWQYWQRQLASMNNTAKGAKPS